ncbi:MAG: MFS transporter [Planctomycetota bacterium]|nr:MFS transporter [Planctomycetota bacterium]
MTRSSRAPLFIIFLTVFIDLLGFGIVLPLLPRYAKSFEASGPMLGLLMASFSIMQFVFAPIWGRISDRVGRRPILILGLAGSAFFYSLFGYCTSLGATGTMLGLGVLPWLFLCRIGAGIAGATIPTAQAYIADVTGPTQRAAGMALIGAAFGIGFTFGPLLGAAFVPGDLSDFRREGNPALAVLHLDESQLEKIDAASVEYRQARKELGKSSNRDQRDGLKRSREEKITEILTVDQQVAWHQLNAPASAPGYVAGVLSFLALLSAIFLLPESLPKDAVPRDRHWLDLTSLKQALGKSSIGLILLTMFLTTFAFAQFESTLSLLTDYLGMADRDNYLVFAYIGFVLTLSQGFLVRRLLPKVGELLMAVTGTVLMTIGFLAVSAAGDQESTSLLYWVLPLAVIGFSASNPSLQSLLSRRTSADQQGGIGRYPGLGSKRVGARTNPRTASGTLSVRPQHFVAVLGGGRPDAGGGCLDLDAAEGKHRRDGRRYRTFRRIGALKIGSVELGRSGTKSLKKPACAGELFRKFKNHHRDT